MSDREALFFFRVKQAEETLSDAEKMLEENVNARSVVNRSYYSMFYMLLALYIKSEIRINTSKHAGIISLFDTEFVHTGKVEKYYSQILHKMFNWRSTADYKELVEISREDAADSVKMAKEFIIEVKKHLLI